MDNNRNLLFAVVLCAVLLIGWDTGMQYLYPQPETPMEAVDPAAGDAPASGSTAATAAGTDGIDAAATAQSGPVDLADALASGNRVQIGNFRCDPLGG